MHLYVIRRKKERKKFEKVKFSIQNEILEKRQKLINIYIFFYSLYNYKKLKIPEANDN